ncbi:MAG: hypothetical protein ACOYJJ_08660 [Anaerovoracaceae bacterium]|jgi:hypothetical protein
MGAKSLKKNKNNKNRRSSGNAASKGGGSKNRTGSKSGSKSGSKAGSKGNASLRKPPGKNQRTAYNPQYLPGAGKKKKISFAGVMIFFILVVLITSFITIEINMLMSKAQAYFLLDPSRIFSERPTYSETLLTFAIEMPLLYLCFLWMYNRYDHVSLSFVPSLTNAIKAYPVIFAVILVLMFLGSFAGVNEVMENKVISHSPGHPAGTTLKFSEVESIDVSFTRQGELTYTVDIGEQTLTFSTPDVNTEKYPDLNGYTAIAELDKKLLKYHPEKTVSKKYSTKYTYTKKEKRALDQILTEK